MCYNESMATLRIPGIAVEAFNRYGNQCSHWSEATRQVSKHRSNGSSHVVGRVGVIFTARSECNGADGDSSHRPKMQALDKRREIILWHFNHRSVKHVVLRSRATLFCRLLKGQTELAGDFQPASHHLPNRSILTFSSQTQTPFHQ